MKVLFAVNDDNISNSIITKYQQKFKEIITSKNVYYFKAIIKEMVSFFSCRIATLLNDMFVYWFGCNVLHLNDFIVKCIAQVIIIVLNFILSKLIVFRKKKNTKEEEKKNEN